MAEISEEKRVEIESLHEINDSLPKVVVYVFAMLLIWAFAIYVYGPLGKELAIAGTNAGDVILVIAVVAILVLVLGILKEIKDICNAIGGLVAARTGRKGASPEEVEHWRTAVKGVAYSIVIALFFMFFGSLLKTAGLEAIAGIALVIIFLVVVVLLFRAAIAINKEITAAVQEKTQRLIEAAEKEAEETKKP
ncbi:MAG: hypothetical protein ACK4YO_00325 [Candidatus Altarchaeaceae archaeon]